MDSLTTLLVSLGADADEYQDRLKPHLEASERELAIAIIGERVLDLQERLAEAESTAAPVPESLAVQALRAIAECHVQRKGQPWIDVSKGSSSYIEKQCAVAKWALNQEGHDVAVPASEEREAADAVDTDTAPVPESLAVRALRAIHAGQLWRTEDPWTRWLTEQATLIGDARAVAGWVLEHGVVEPVSEELKRLRLFVEIVAAKTDQEGRALIPDDWPQKDSDVLWGSGYFERLARYVIKQTAPVGSVVDVEG